MGRERPEVLTGDWSLYDALPGSGAAPVAAGLTVPATVASALRAAGQWAAGDERDLDAQDWWWVGAFDVLAGEGSWTLRAGGLATIVDVSVDGAVVLHSDDMFVGHHVPLGALAAGPHEVVVRCAALTPLVTARHPRPRWRTRLVRHQHLRWYRTSLLGRIPGWSPDGAPIGPWRGVDLVRGPHLVERRVDATVDGDRGTVAIDVVIHGTVASATATAAAGAQRVTAAVEAVDGGVRVRATIHLDDVARWWPWTHGPQPRYPVSVAVGDDEVDLGAVGFRSLRVDTAADGFGLVVNDVPVFCRGATWTPIDPVSLASDADELAASLDDVRRAGFNMVRISGTMVPEVDAFYEACDARGILVWHDVMLANMDPPDDPAFSSAVEREVEQLLGRLAGRPCLGVVCGGSEVEQQAAMLGLPRDQWAMPLVHDRLPAVVARLAPGVPYVPSTPTGGALPFHADRGVTHYYGLGAYLRPLDDVRRSRVRFAAECLAFANVPDESLVDDVFGGPAAAGHHPDWKRAVPRDSGASWDFEDVRDHYVEQLFGVRLRDLRYTDPARALDLGRAATGELMAATFAEWRRPGSGCAGGLIWFLRDLYPGAGWGIVDSRGTPKAAWWYVRRTLAPTALFVTDEGLNGLHLHVVNDGPDDFAGRVRVELFTNGELRTETVDAPVDVGAHAGVSVVADALFDGFRDLTWAYRFGPCAHDVVAATLLDADGSVVSRATHLPLGLARAVEADLGLTATATPAAGGAWNVTLRSRRFASAVRLDVPGWRPGDNWFDLPPATDHVVALEPLPAGAASGGPTGSVRALNAAGPVRIEGG